MVTKADEEKIKEAISGEEETEVIEVEKPKKSLWAAVLQHRCRRWR